MATSRRLPIAAAIAAATERWNQRPPSVTGTGGTAEPAETGVETLTAARAMVRLLSIADSSIVLPGCHRYRPRRIAAPARRSTRDAAIATHHRWREDRCYFIVVEYKSALLIAVSRTAEAAHENAQTPDFLSR
jgi:hypothetical protein